MSEEKEGALGAEETNAPPVVADYTDSMDREEAHEQAREVAPEPRPKKGKAKDDDDKRFVGLLNETLSEREKRQRAEAERDQYRIAWEQHQRKLAAEQDRDPAPDMFKDPNAYNAWVERQLDKRAKAIASEHVTPLKGQLADYALRVSEMTAEKALGEKRWNALNDWIEGQSPQFKQWAMSQPDPYAAAYQHYRQASTFDRLGNDDLDTFLEKQKAEWMKANAPAPGQAFDEPAAPPLQTRAMPASFAAKSSTGGDRTSPAAGPTPLGQILKDKPNKRQR